MRRVYGGWRQIRTMSVFIQLAMCGGTVWMLLVSRNRVLNFSYSRGSICCIRM